MPNAFFTLVVELALIAFLLGAWKAGPTGNAFQDTLPVVIAVTLVAIRCRSWWQEQNTAQLLNESLQLAESTDSQWQDTQKQLEATRQEADAAQDALANTITGLNAELSTERERANRAAKDAAERFQRLQTANDEEIRKHKTSLAELSAARDVLQTEYDKHKARLAEVTADRDQLKSHLAEATAGRAMLQTVCDTANARLDALQKEQVKSAAEIADWQDRVRNLTLKVEKYRDGEKQAEETRTTLTSKIAQLESDLRERTAAHNEARATLDAKVAKLESELRERGTEHDALFAKFRDAEKQIVKHQEEAKRAGAEYNAITAEATRLGERKTDLEHQLREELDRGNELRAKLSAAEEAATNLQADNYNLRRTVKELEAEKGVISTLRADLEKATQAHEQLKQDNRALQAQLEQALLAHEPLKRENRALQAQHDEAIVKESQTRSLADRLKMIVTDLEDELNRARAERNEARTQSTSERERAERAEALAAENQHAAEAHRIRADELAERLGIREQTADRTQAAADGRISELTRLLEAAEASRFHLQGELEAERGSRAHAIERADRLSEVLAQTQSRLDEREKQMAAGVKIEPPPHELEVAFAAQTARVAELESAIAARDTEINWLLQQQAALYEPPAVPVAALSEVAAVVSESPAPVVEPTEAAVAIQSEPPAPAPETAPTPAPESAPEPAPAASA